MVLTTTTEWACEATLVGWKQFHNFWKRDLAPNDLENFAVNSHKIHRGGVKLTFFKVIALAHCYSFVLSCKNRVIAKSQDKIKFITNAVMLSLPPDIFADSTSTRLVSSGI